jgi:hypothetical protein
MSVDATGTDGGHPLTVAVIPQAPSAPGPGGGVADPIAPDATATAGGHPLTVTVIPPRPR